MLKQDYVPDFRYRAESMAQFDLVLSIGCDSTYCDIAKKINQLSVRKTDWKARLRSAVFIIIIVSRLVP